MDPRRDFSLRRLALLSWSASFWNRQSVKQEIQRIIDDVKDRSGTRNLIVLAKDELKAMNLPNVIYDELIHRITWLGERVFKWYKRYRNFRLPWRFTRKIHWTVFGTIDEAKTVEKNFLRPFATLSSYPAMDGVYYMACTSALKDYVNRNATEIIDFCRRHEKERKYEHKDIPLFYRSVLTLANPENLNLSNKETNELISEYFDNLNCSKEAFMFQYSVDAGYAAAAEYYWQQLNPSEKENNLMDAAMKWIQSYTLDIDVLVFLLSEMSENQRETFFGYIVGRCNTSKCFHILWAFMRSCAWEDHFFPVFYLLEDLKEHEEKYIYHVLNRIISTWKRRLTVGLDAKNPVYKQMFFAVWRRLKTFHSKNHHYDRRFLRNSFEPFDMDVFNAVLEKYNFRQEFFRLGETHYRDLLMENRFDLLKEFMGTVLTSREERAWFKNELITKLDDVLRKLKFNVADNLLNWLSDSKEERERIKLKFDFLSLCAVFFINENFTSATELITWGFSNEQERDQYVNGIVSSDLNWLHVIWRRNKDNLVTSLFEFLQMFFDTKDEYVGRKIAKLLTEDALRKFFMKINDSYCTNCSLTRKAFQTLDELMEFCLPLEDGPKLKFKIAENAGKWLMNLALKNLCWGGADFFLNWILGFEIKRFEEKKTILDLEKKREFVQRFLLSADGIKFLERISMSNHLKIFKRYACLLVDWAGGVGLIENYVNELEPSNSHVTNYNFKNASLKNMLQSFKNGEVEYESLEHICRFQGNSNLLFEFP